MSENTTKRRYKGYDLDARDEYQKRKNQPWFWKILGISLLLTVVIIAIIIFCLLHRSKKNAKYMENINASNTMDALLKNHSTVTLTCSYAHLKEGSDYTTVRQVSKDKKGNYYSYFKKEGSDSDYKEVIKDKALYQNNGKYTTYYGLIGDDYKNTCVSEIEGSVYQGNRKDQVKNEKEHDDVVTIQTSYEVQKGDSYQTTYGFSTGDSIEKTIIMDKKTQIITSVEEKYDEEVFYSYTVEFDGEEKVPKFFKALEKEKETRKCTIYSDYNGDDNKKYTFTIPIDLYFDVLDHDGYQVFEDEDLQKEFTQYQMEIQNPETDLELYVKAASESSTEASE